MVGSVFLPALAALLVQAGVLPTAPAPARDSPPARDSAALAGAIDGQRLDLALRGVGRSVRAEALPAESGCSTLIMASTPDGSDAGTRLLRWADVAWTGALPDGRVMVAFFEQEGRLPGDRLAFAPADPAAFQTALKRVTESCRGAASERGLSGDYSGSRSCYFARAPGLELIEHKSPSPQEPARAVMAVLARETPDAELRLLVERGAGGEGWAQPEVAFTIAGAVLENFRIGVVHFALDGAQVEARHSIAVYNGTRLRIRMGHAIGGASAGSEGSFYLRLASSQRATVTLIDSGGKARAVLNFDVGPALAAARRSLDATAWSCVDAPPPSLSGQLQFAE